MEHKKIIIIVMGVLLVAGLAGVSIYRDTYKQPIPQEVPEATVATSTITVEARELPLTDESHFQQQIQQIISTGSDADCDTISNTRYKDACHSVFKSRGGE